MFHPHNSSLIVTVGFDGVVRCTDVRIGGVQKDGGGDGVVKTIQTDAPLTCASFHHEVPWCLHWLSELVVLTLFSVVVMVGLVVIGVRSPYSRPCRFD